jgi:hypothetical protein
MNEKQNHIDLSIVDQTFGTHLNDLPATVNEIQAEVAQIAPVIKFARTNWPQITLVLFLIMVLASFIGSKIAK